MAGLALTKGALEDLTEDIREWFPALPASSIMRRGSSLKSSKVGIFVPSRTVSARQNCYSWNFHYALQPEEYHTFIRPHAIVKAIGDDDGFSSAFAGHKAPNDHAGSPGEIVASRDPLRELLGESLLTLV